MEAVRYVRSVRYIFDDSIFLTELLNLCAAKRFCWCTVDCIQPTVFLLEISNLLIDVLQCLKSKSTVLYQRLSVVHFL